jgi:hypothetical protein
MRSASHGTTGGCSCTGSPQESRQLSCWLRIHGDGGPWSLAQHSLPKSQVVVLDDQLKSVRRN